MRLSYLLNYTTYNQIKKLPRSNPRLSNSGVDNPKLKIKFIPLNNWYPKKIIDANPIISTVWNLKKKHILLIIICRIKIYRFFLQCINDDMYNGGFARLSEIIAT